MQEKEFIQLLVINTVIVIVYCIVNLFLKKEKRAGFVFKSVVMLLCPLIGPVLFFFGYLMYKGFFAEIADLSDVVFSKDRVETHMKADEEQERNMVSLEEALAITDKGSLRNLMLNVVRGDVKNSLASISMALDSEDSETAHYAASVLQDELNNFRNEVQKTFLYVQEEHEDRIMMASKLLDDMDSVLRQKVFTEVEQASFVEIMEKTLQIMYDLDKEKISGLQYEAVCIRLLELKKYGECEVWAERLMEQYPDYLSAYTCKLKLYFSMGEKEKFFEVMNQLKASSIVIDNETLEMIRVFGNQKESQKGS